MYNYIVHAQVETAELLPSVGTTVKELNHIMSGFGFSEKLVLITDLPISITTNQPIGSEAQILIEATILTNLKKQWPSVKIISFETL